MSSIHSLQRSTTSQKLLKSVQALRPFLCDSLRKNGFDPFEYTKCIGSCGDKIIDHEHADTNLQTPCYGNYDKDSPLQCQNAGNLGSEEHGQAGGPDHQVHMVYEHNEGIIAGYSSTHAEYHVGEGRHDSGPTHQQYNHIECGYNAIVHDEDNGLTGYVHDDYYMNYPAPADQCIGYGHASSHMPESRIDNPDMLSSLQPSICLHGTHSLNSLGFNSHEYDCSFPTEGTLQPTLHPHNIYSCTHLHSQHNYQEFHHYPQRQDIIDGIAASMYNVDLVNTHEARCNNSAINKPVTPVFLSASTEAQVRETTCAKAPSLPKSQQRKRRRTKPLPDTNAERNDSFDEGDATRDDDDDNCSDPNALKVSGFSSNLVCERRRRKKINEALYMLRSVVPVVSKMDKASIMSDALAYAKQLRKRVDDLQNDILSLQAGKDDVDRTSINEHVQEASSSSTRNLNKGMDFEKYIQSLPKHKILELSVFDMENSTYHLRICCKRGPGDLLQLARLIEALNFDILNSSVASVGDQSTINTVLAVKVDNDEVLKPEQVKEMLLEIVSKYGLHVYRPLDTHLHTGPSEYI